MAEAFWHTHTHTHTPACASYVLARHRAVLEFIRNLSNLCDAPREHVEIMTVGIKYPTQALAFFLPYFVSHPLQLPLERTSFDER